jgi:NADH-quinone oxidoreductase subunit N
MEFSLPIFNITVLYPILALVITAIILVLWPLFIPRTSRNLLAATAIAGLLISAWFLLQLWSKPQTGMNNMLVMDYLAISVHVALILAGALTVLISLNRVELEYIQYGELFGLILLALAGMMIMTSTWNLLVMFLGLEVFSLSLYVLAGIRKMRMDSVEAALKYLLLGAFATGFILYGMALIYGVTGTLELATITSGLEAEQNTLLLYAGFLLLFVGMAFKAAFVPFHMWTPDVYQGAATPVTAFMSTATKATALAVLIRVVGISVMVTPVPWSKIIVVIAVMTMTVGNLLALSQKNVKRMLAYSSIAHAGYLLVGLVAFNQAGSQAILYYLFVYTMMNMGAFGVISYMGESNQNERVDSEDYRGLGYRLPFASFCLAVFMFGLAGIPPTGGFVGKFFLFSAAVQQGYLGLVIVAVINSVISVYYYLRLVINLYMREGEASAPERNASPGLLLALTISVVMVLLLGVYPGLVTDWLQTAIRLWP